MTLADRRRRRVNTVCPKENALVIVNRHILEAARDEYRIASFLLATFRRRPGWYGPSIPHAEIDVLEALDRLWETQEAYDTRRSPP